MALSRRNFQLCVLARRLPTGSLFLAFTHMLLYEIGFFFFFYTAVFLKDLVSISYSGLGSITPAPV